MDTKINNRESWTQGIYSSARKRQRGVHNSMIKEIKSHEVAQCIKEVQMRQWLPLPEVTDVTCDLALDG